MVKLNEIASTSTFAWSTDVIPVLATGTVAGAVDASFNSSLALEIWDTFLATDKKAAVFSASVEDRFYALAWSKPFEGRPRGLLAGAFENGVVEFWDADVLLRTKDLAQASVHKLTKHKGAVKSLQFNPQEPHILVTGGLHGEIFIWDTKAWTEPLVPGKAMTPMDEITAVAWNNNVSHIFASTSNGGFTSIWDLKSKREVLHLLYSARGRAEFSSVAWHPLQLTKLVTGSESDGCPLILTWDLRNSNEPEKVLQGHKKGVLSLDWCTHDANLLISSGKDNSTMLWNPLTAEKLAEYPTTANWAFQTRFAPACPDIFATASFDGKVIVQTLQDTLPPVSTKVRSEDDTQFWSEISTTDTQQPVYSKVQAPEWLKRPVSASFGFGSKLVQVVTDAEGKSVVKVGKFVVNKTAENGELAQALETNDFGSIIDSKIEANASDSADWSLLKKLAAEGKKTLFSNLVKTEEEPLKLDAKPEETEDGAEDSFFENLGTNGTSLKSSFVPSGSFKLSGSKDKQLVRLVLANKIEEAVRRCLDEGKLVEALVLALDAPESVKNTAKNAFFEKNTSDQLARVIYSASYKNVTDIVSNADVSDWREIAASILAFSSGEDDFNNKIIHLGDRILEAREAHREDAITCYLAGDALDKVAAIWLKELPSFEAAVLKSGNSTVSSPSDARFVALNNFMEKITAYRAISKINGEFSGPAIEPTCLAVLEYANLVAGYGQFELADRFLALLPGDFAGLKLEKERISKASGVKSAVSRAPASYAGRVPAQTSKYGSPVVRNAIPTNVPPARSSVSGARPAPVGQYGSQLGSYAPPPSQFGAGVPPVNQFGAIPPAGNQVASTPPIGGQYAPSTPQFAPANNPYAAPSAYHAPPAPVANPYKPAGIVAPAHTMVSPPPVAAPKPKYKQETDGWNDLPDSFKPKTAPRRAAAASVSPAPAPVAYAPPAAPSRNALFVSPGLPPPPKGASRSASKTNVTETSQESAPVRLVSSRYAPPPGLNSPSQATFAPPPAQASPGPAPRNPYAPAPGSGSAPALHANSSVLGAPAFALQPTQAFAPPVGSVAPPPKNPYAPPPVSNSAGLASPGIMPPPRAGIVSPPSFTGAGGVAPPPMGGIAPPPPLGGTAPPPAGAVSAPPPPPAKPVKEKYPAGDRSHIPEESLPVFASLSKLLEDVKPRVPERYLKHAEDMEKRLNLLFDHLNNEDLLSSETVAKLKTVCSALEAKDYASANALNVEIATAHSEEIGNWHTGVKRLINMSEAL